MLIPRCYRHGFVHSAHTRSAVTLSRTQKHRPLLLLLCLLGEARFHRPDWDHEAASTTIRRELEGWCTVNEALFATLAGILGIVLGRFWDARSEAGRWHRDQKTESYQHLAEAFIFLYEKIRSIALAEPDTEESNSAIDQYRLDNTTWANALFGVWLYGSAPVATAASLADLAAKELYRAAQARLFSLEDWDQARIPSVQAFEKFMSIARKDLHLSPVPGKLFPYTS
jgi:hypothetical protein